MNVLRWFADRSLPACGAVLVCLGMLAHSFLIDAVERQEAERRAADLRICRQFNQAVQLQPPNALAWR